jgi:SAM-dependent methyltransferase
MIFVVDCTAAQISEMYEHYYDHATFKPPLPFVVAALNRMAATAAPFRRSGRWLDFGYGEGALLRVAAQHGWTCYGVEVSPAALTYGASQGWTVAPDIADPRLPRHGFDVVTLIELMEHVTEPDSVLSAAAKMLRPGGLLYLTTPNARSLNRWMLGTSWSVFSPPEHLNIWTPRSLCWALNGRGFRSVHVRTEGLNPVEILARLRSRALRTEVPVDRGEAARALGAALAQSTWRRAAKSAINDVLSAVSLGDTIKCWATAGDRT